MTGAKKYYQIKKKIRKKGNYMEMKEKLEKNILQSFDRIEETKENKINVEVNDFKLGEEQQKMYNKVENTYDNYLITGKAGTGKSELLKYLVKHTSKKTIVLAPTGIAALNIGGMTLHSLFHFDWGIQEEQEIIDKWYEHSSEILKVVDMIVLDEIFMIRPDLFEAVSIILQNVRKCYLPFGGVQIVGFGDPYQLPPIINNKYSDIAKYIQHKYNGNFFFNAPSFKDGEFKIYELTHVYRQNDSKFIDILNQIRDGSYTLQTLEEINKRVLEPLDKENIVFLNTTRKAVDTINSSELSKLNNETYHYLAETVGNIDEGYYPTDYDIELKKDAHVIMVANDPNGRWVNGTPGIITDLFPNYVIVKIAGVEYPVGRKKWEKKKYQYNAENDELTQYTDGEFKQLPLKLAWAMTVHKSQSKTYDSILVDLSNGAFECGQVYVALSRCRTMEKLYLKRPITPKDIKVNQEIKKFMSNINILRFE